MDEERLRAERANRGSWKSRVTGLEDLGGSINPPDDAATGRRERRRTNRDGDGDDDLEYRLALEASKNEAEADEARRKAKSGAGDDDDDLQKAIKLSQEEEELRRRELEDQNNANLLFDSTPAQAPQPTGFNQGYQQQAAVDWFGNPVDQQQQQPQQTGFLNNAYSQPTGYQNGFTGGFGHQQPQQTGFEQMQQPQQQFLQPQNTYNPWAQQMNGFGQPQQQQQPAQEQSTSQPGTNNPWATNNSMSPPVPVQPTGSNNPFATNRPQPTQSPFKGPTLSTLQEQATSNAVNARPNPISKFTAPQQPVATPSPAPQQQQRPPQPENPYQARLNALLASGEGQDTFGNVGDLRIPSQHTAPGTFINSAGAGSMGRLEAAKTGNNPFYNQQSAAQFQYPAQTGPATGFGGANNPFASRPPQQQTQQQGHGQQGGSLIDL